MSELRKRVERLERAAIVHNADAETPAPEGALKLLGYDGERRGYVVISDNKCEGGSK